MFPGAWQLGGGAESSIRCGRQPSAFRPAAAVRRSRPPTRRVLLHVAFSEKARREGLLALEDDLEEVVHIDFTVPYAESLRGELIEAAKKQGKYWETLNVMYKSQPYWASHHNPQPERIWQFLPQAGLNLEKIKKDMNDPAIAKLIKQDLADAKTLNVRKTPGFFVNGKPLQTFGYQQLLQLVQTEIRANYPN